MDDDEKYWRDEVKRSTRGELDTVRKAATAWTGLFAAVVGIFGTVAFAGGLTPVDEVPSSYRSLVVGMTIAAAVCMLAAIVLAGLAAGPTAKASNSEAWQDFAGDVRTAAHRALWQLRLAKCTGSLAAAMILGGSTLILVVGEAASSTDPSAVLVIVDGTAVCGKLTRSAGTDIAVQGVTLRAADISFLQIVEACP